ncbi:hypothetical protein GCM10008932_17640 [Alkalibacterium iburiense]|uniref:NERD domain-containing protein n=1 Tax=Alkalibacterium iburiense TaxID=290589 RepID=A0ABN0XJQ6_9LACT
MVIIFLIFIMILFIMLPMYLKFNESNYTVASGNSFLKTVFDKGNYGEFLTYYTLEQLPIPKKLLSNAYIPKEDGSTSEVDLIMLAETGIYVFESKNYSGWIFGNEKYKQWTQTMPNGQKFKFFNPVWQNNAHINAIKKYSGLTDRDLFQSYIIFSERCTLKDITIHSPRIKVMKRNRLHSIIKQDIMESEKVLSLQEVLTLFNQLNKHTLADEQTKRAHIERVKLKS